MTEATLNIVVMYPNELDKDELLRVKNAIKQLSGADLRPICPTGSALVFLVNAPHGQLARRIDEVVAIGTQYFISQLSEPWSTRGFAPTAGLIKKHLSQE